MRSSAHPSQTKLGAAVIALAAGAGAFAVDRTFAAIAVGLAIGLLIVGVHALMHRVWQRFLPAPRLSPEAGRRERALAARRYALRSLIAIVPLVALGWALALLLPEDGPSIHGLVVFSLPLLVVAANVVYTTVRARRE